MIFLVNKISDNLALFQGKTDLLTRLLTNKLLKSLMPNVDMTKIKEKNWKKL